VTYMLGSLLNPDFQLYVNKGKVITNAPVNELNSMFLSCITVIKTFLRVSRKVYLQLLLNLK
jgi:hypothetical protein